jgi:hypothetical protein
VHVAPTVTTWARRRRARHDLVTAVFSKMARRALVDVAEPAHQPRRIDAGAVWRVGAPSDLDTEVRSRGLVLVEPREVVIAIPFSRAA